MATKSMGNYDLVYRGPEAERVTEKVPVQVTDEGIFRIKLPEQMIEPAKDFQLHGHDWRIVTYRSHTYVEGKDLQFLKKILTQLWKGLHEMAFTDELVIHYDYRATCHYCFGSDDQLYPNGSLTPDNYFKWNETVNGPRMSHNSSPTDYSVGLKAKVVVKRTHTLGENTKVTFESPRESDLEVGEWGEKLNEFVKVCMDDIFHEVPYTEEIARGFYEGMLALCHVDQRIQQLLQDPQEVIVKLTGGMPLLAFQGNES